MLSTKDAHLNHTQTVARIMNLASRLHFRLGPAFQRLLGEGVHSSGKRALMRNLVELGPLTIPQMAAMRPVSRQFIRALVEEMKADGWVEDRPNPKHKTAHLIDLTDLGKLRANQDLATERDWIATIAEDLNQEEAAIAVRVLSALIEKVDEEIV